MFDLIPGIAPDTKRKRSFFYFNFSVESVSLGRVFWEPSAAMTQKCFGDQMQDPGSTLTRAWLRGGMTWGKNVSINDFYAPHLCRVIVATSAQTSRNTLQKAQQCRVLIKPTERAWLTDNLNSDRRELFEKANPSAHHWEKYRMYI